MNQYIEMTQDQAQDLADRINSALDYNKANIALTHDCSYGVSWEIFHGMRIGFCLEELTREVDVLESMMSKASSTSL
jgi:hypothetical protein